METTVSASFPLRAQSFALAVSSLITRTWRTSSPFAVAPMHNSPTTVVATTTCTRHVRVAARGARGSSDLYAPTGVVSPHRPTRPPQPAGGRARRAAARRSRRKEPTRGLEPRTPSLRGSRGTCRWLQLIAPNGETAPFGTVTAFRVLPLVQGGVLPSRCPCADSRPTSEPAELEGGDRRVVGDVDGHPVDALGAHPAKVVIVRRAARRGVRCEGLDAMDVPPSRYRVIDFRGRTSHTPRRVEVPAQATTRPLRRASRRRSRLAQAKVPKGRSRMYGATE